MTTTPPANIQEHIARIVAEAPPLMNEQRDRLACLLRGKRDDLSGPLSSRERREPAPTVLYRHYDRCGHLIYIGITSDFVGRGYQHVRKSWWAKWSARVDKSERDGLDRDQALAVERAAICDERPIFNRVHAVDGRDARIVRYLIDHEEWGHLTIGGFRGGDTAVKKDVILRLLEAGAAAEAAIGFSKEEQKS